MMLGKKRLLYIIHDLKVGGVETAFLSSLEQLNQSFDLAIIVLGTISKQLLPSVEKVKGIKIFYFNHPLYQYPLYFYKVIRWAKSFAPDVTISSLWRSSLAGVIIKKLNITPYFISFVHNTYFFHFLDKRFTKLAIKTADCIFVDAQATADFVKNKLQSNALVQVISFLKDPTLSYKDRIISPENVRFMTLSRINRVKNVPLAIKAIHDLRQKEVNATMDIYGPDDGDLERVLQIIGELNLENYVKWKGEVLPDKVNELFGQYDFYVQMSSNEGMAMSVAEAMQNGLVCIVTPVGEIPNYSKDMYSAIFVNTDSDSTWTQSIDKIIAVTKDRSLYNMISRNCHSFFWGKQIYRESLVNNIQDVLLNRQFMEEDKKL